MLSSPEDKTCHDKTDDGKKQRTDHVGTDHHKAPAVQAPHEQVDDLGGERRKRGESAQEARRQCEANLWRSTGMGREELNRDSHQKATGYICRQRSER